MALIVTLYVGFVLFVYAGSSAPGQKIITAEPGQNVTLTCRAPNNNIIVVEWTRTDLGEEYVLMDRGSRELFLDGQHSSFKNRVDLQDRRMKDGDVCLILRNVTTDDGGTYECRVSQKKSNRWKRGLLKTDPICTMKLEVAPSGNKDGRGEGGGEKDDNSLGHHGLIVCISVGISVIVAGAVGVLILRSRRRR